MMQVPKNIRDDLGGGMKEFTLKEASSFQDIEEMNNFLTSQERQAIILHLLHSLRAEAVGDSVSKLRFREGKAISKFYFLFSMATLNKFTGPEEIVHALQFLSLW